MLLGSTMFSPRIPAATPKMLTQKVAVVMRMS